MSTSWKRLELICCRLVQSFFLADVVPTLSVSDSSERDGVSKLASSSWGPVKLGGCNRVESLQISILASSYLVVYCSTGWWCSRSAPLLRARSSLLLVQACSILYVNRLLL
ncbi:unnamed protein product [Brassica rapa subsp. trilocularis]|uniref:(rape) hypothetical protein n=1 Tax=Brassica napus TaxID=3708 RepID=A0A078GIK3_BRANA|nr:unnamed protein product [Brassica napus]CDY26305.1 BnaA09g26560D [Brassica napus]